MARPIELIPLLCLQCSARLPAQPGETAWVCAQCGQGQQLDEKAGLLPLSVHYAAGIEPASGGSPYWVVEGQAVIDRKTYSGNEERAAFQFWNQARRFIIPAFDCSLEMLLTQGMAFLRQPPPLAEGAPAPFSPVTLARDDVSSVAEFIVVAIEAERKDKVKEIQFKLTLGDPVLWILP